MVDMQNNENPLTPQQIAEKGKMVYEERLRSILEPIAKALPLGLVLFSSALFTLADDSKEDTFLCSGKAKLDGQEREVIFALTKGSDILAGIDFLESFKAKLELDYEKKIFF